MAQPVLVSLSKRIDLASRSYAETGDIEYKNLYDRLVAKSILIKEEIIRNEGT